MGNLLTLPLNVIHSALEGYSDPWGLTSYGIPLRVLKDPKPGLDVALIGKLCDVSRLFKRAKNEGEFMEEPRNVANLVRSSDSLFICFLYFFLFPFIFLLMHLLSLVFTSIPYISLPISFSSYLH